jgi:hypothetical protein
MQYDSDPDVVRTQIMIDEGKMFKGKSFIEDKERSLNSIAQIIETQGSCMLWFWFDTNGYEWWKPYPKVLYPNLGVYDSGATRHALVATDYGLIGGKKYIKIEDSAGNWTAINQQDRFIDEDFLKRCFVSGYIIDEVTPPPQDKPQWIGARNLGIGMEGPDVKVLQDILKLEGFFNYPTSTGYFGGITKAGVIKLQEKYRDEILTPLGLSKGTGYVGASTLKWLTNNYK